MGSLNAGFVMVFYFYPCTLHTLNSYSTFLKIPSFTISESFMTLSPSFIISSQLPNLVLPSISFLLSTHTATTLVQTLITLLLHYFKRLLIKLLTFSPFPASLSSFMPAKIIFLKLRFYHAHKPSETCCCL